MSEADINKKKHKYILVTHGDSYLGRILAIYLAEEIFKRDRKEHWFVRVLCKENTTFKKEFEKRGIDVKQVDYENQGTIREAMRGHIKTMIFNPFTEDERLDMQGMNVLDVARDEKIKMVIMLSSFGVFIQGSKDSSYPLSQFATIEEHLKQLDEYGKWVIFRIPFIQQYLYFWSKMVEDKNVLGIPMSQADCLETIHIKDVCNCVAQAALTKKSMVWQASYLQKRVYDLKSTPSFSLLHMAKSLSDSLKEGESDNPDICPLVITEEQMQEYLKRLSQEKDMTGILGSIAIGKFEASKSGLVQSVVGSLYKQIFGGVVDQEDCSGWYPHPTQVLTPFCIRLIMEHFKLARNPQWMPVIGKSTDVRDITGNDPIPVSKFFMNNYRRFQK